METILSLLDKDRNGYVDFQEYLLLVFQLAQACYGKLDRESCGDRTSKQKGQEGTEDQKSPGHKDRAHKQRHEGERQGSHRNQSERQNKDTSQDQSERQDGDSRSGQSETQGQDSRSGHKLSHNSSSGQPKKLGNIFALSQCEKQVQDARGGGR